jgi:hypothetical protein
MNMRPTGCPETSVRNYYYSLRNNPEERSSVLNAGTSAIAVCVQVGTVKGHSVYCKELGLTAAVYLESVNEVCPN